MTDITRVRHAQAFGVVWIHKPERMAANIHIAESCGDLGHVALNALISSTSGMMMRMGLNGWSMRPIG